VTAAPPPKKTLGAGKYEDTEPDIDYSGGWTHGKFKQAGEGSVTFSNQPGDTLRLMFNGSSIIYVYTKAANRGTAQVSIDGREIAQINLYSRRTQWQAQTIFVDLGVGQHTLEIRVLNVKDAGSSDYFVDLDRLIVRP
jgi:hypothetical protein